jgi:AP-4 complex subunit epsilon-1
LTTLKGNVANSKVTLKLMKEYIVRVLYCEMLGHDASFGYIYAIKLASSKSLLEKRVGYLAVSLCVPNNHELLLLIIATLQRVCTVLQSTN